MDWPFLCLVLAIAALPWALDRTARVRERRRHRQLAARLHELVEAGRADPGEGH